MRRYVAGRLLLMIPTLIGVAILTFVIMRAVPGDIVALKYAGSPVPQSVIDEERHQLGLDKPMWEQFTDWMGDIARFDLRFATGDVKSVLSRFCHVRARIGQRAPDNAGALFDDDCFGLRRSDIDSGCESH